MKRKEVKETIKICIELYTKFEYRSKSDLEKEFYAGKVHSYKHVLWLLEESNDNCIL